jgi:hypothetical protein
MFKKIHLSNSPDVMPPPFSYRFIFISNFALEACGLLHQIARAFAPDEDDA